MAKICLCLTAKTLKRNLEILNKYRKYADLAELRVDCLEPDERFLIRRFPEMAELPVILTIRRIGDGGYFSSGEGARVNLMARGLAYAEANRRLNFAYVDIEEDLNVPSLEEAARTFGTRIIRSWHSIHGNTADISPVLRGMKCMSDDLVKIAVKTNSASDVLRVLKTTRKYPRKEKIVVCMGQHGMCSRILAEQFGSYLSYTSAPGEPDIPRGAEGQVDIPELADLYRFRTISKSTKIFGMLGIDPMVSEYLRFFNTVFEMENTDAVYLPFPADSIVDFMELADGLNISGLSLTGCSMEEIIPFLNEQSARVKSSGMCTGIYRSSTGWAGTNTVAQGFSASLMESIGRKNLHGKKITVIGAGSMAKLISGELYRLGAKVLILNHSVHKARELAARYKFAWGGLDSRGIEMIEKYQDIIIQAASQTPESEGMGEGNDGDRGLYEHGLSEPWEIYVFSGRETVMDLVNKPEHSYFIKQAAEAGCRIINGYDTFIRQVQYQYAQFMGRDFPSQLLTRVRLGGN